MDNTYYMMVDGKPLAMTRALNVEAALVKFNLYVEHQLKQDLEEYPFEVLEVERGIVCL